MNDQQQWYVTIAGSAVGPVSTDLVLRGIKHKKIATEAYVCVVGASEWQALSDVPEFHGALTAAQATAHQEQAAEALSSVDDDDESETTAQFPSNRRRSDIEYEQGAQVPAAAAHDEQSAFSSPAPANGEVAQRPLSQATSAELAAYTGDDTSAATSQAAAVSAPELVEPPTTETEQPLPSAPRNGTHASALGVQAQMPGIEVDIDISMDESEAPSIDWSHGFSDYFLVDAEVTLPDDQLLLRSLSTTPHDTFLHDEPMWNLALCLAFGSNMVASVAADVFFEVVAAHNSYDRIEWMARTLLSRGFMPSGIPHPAGNRGIGRLRQACPEELRVQLESQLAL